MEKSGSPARNSEARTAAKGADVRIAPPMVLTAFFGTSLLAHAAGIRIGVPAPALARWLLGGALVGVAAALISSAHREHDKTGQDPAPWTPSPSLMSTGAYRWSRNPMYTGVAVGQIGVGLLLNNLVIVAGAGGYLFAIYLLAVRPEEKYLESVFGEPYASYRRRVRRWL
jgi:protein-S-isoprenylcysteine O-methyltransferase Ste14